MTMSIKKSGLGKFLVGAGLGAGLAMLLTKKTGKENREQLKKKVDIGMRSRTGRVRQDAFCGAVSTMLTEQGSKKPHKLLVRKHGIIENNFCIGGDYECLVVDLNISTVN